MSNLNKVLFPSIGLTKGDVIRYYRKIGSVALPHLRDRPFTFKRYPSGTDGESFYEKECPSHRPGWVRTHDFNGVNFCLINDLPTLVWAANLAAIELHTTLATVRDLGCPTTMIFDLDPGDGAGIQECAQVALWIRDLIEASGLISFPKTSGKKGLHLYVPLNTAISYEQTKNFAQSVAENLERAHPDAVTSRMAKKLRTGKVFVDWSQNVDFKTTTTVYSLRATELAGVSTPVSWDELKAASRSVRRAQELAAMGIGTVLSRIQRHGDLFEPVLSMRQKLASPVALAPMRLRRPA